MLIMIDNIQTLIITMKVIYLIWYKGDHNNQRLRSEKCNGNWVELILDGNFLIGISHKRFLLYSYDNVFTDTESQVMVSHTI